MIILLLSMVGLSSLSLFITRLHLHCWWSNLQSILSHCISICSWVSWVDMPPLDIHQVTNQQSLFSSYYHTWYYDHLHHMINHFTFRVRLSSAKKFCDDGISCANMCKYVQIFSKIRNSHNLWYHNNPQETNEPSNFIIVGKTSP